MIDKIADRDFMAQMLTNEKVSLLEISEKQPVMLVFLRRFGCNFCRQSLEDIADEQARIEEMGTKIVFVHIEDNKDATHFFEKYNIKNPVHISDPNCEIYTAFGLLKGSLNQLFGLQTWMSGIKTTIKHGTSMRNIGDGFQMPGIFLIVNGEIKAEFIHKFVSDKPDYLELAACCSI